MVEVEPAGGHRSEDGDGPADGQVEQHVDDAVFGDLADSLDAFVERKRALADSLRYALLYYVYEATEGEDTESVPRQELSRVTGRDSSGNDLQSVLRPLLEANLLVTVPTPEGADGRKTYYRLSYLGKREIEADQWSVHGTPPE